MSISRSQWTNNSNSGIAKWHFPNLILLKYKCLDIKNIYKGSWVSLYCPTALISGHTWILEQQYERTETSLSNILDLQSNKIFLHVGYCFFQTHYSLVCIISHLGFSASYGKCSVVFGMSKKWDSRFNQPTSSKQIMSCPLRQWVIWCPRQNCRQRPLVSQSISQSIFIHSHRNCMYIFKILFLLSQKYPTK